jgi:hypothetical protein
VSPAERALVLLLAALALDACSECTGTVSCSTPPTISYTGQFIDRPTGVPVPGVVVSFLRDSGVTLSSPTITATSDGDGFFRLRATATEGGQVYGALQVVPPAPVAPYTVPGITLTTTNVRGSGGWLGRMMTVPYYFILGFVYDRNTHETLPDVTVIMRRTAGGRAADDTVKFRTDFGGVFSWDAPLIIADTIVATFEIRAAGYPRSYFVERRIPVQFRDDSLNYVFLPVGSGLSYVGTTGRRGSGEQLAGTTVTFHRTGGIAVMPSDFSESPDKYGTFAVPLQPKADGTVFGILQIVPPSPYPTEHHDLALTTSDDDVVNWLGVLGYGAQVYAKLDLRDASTGAPIPSGTGVRLVRVSGVDLDWTSPTPAINDRAVGGNGRLVYQAPAKDSGDVVYDMIVRLPPPLIPDTIHGLTLPARYSDSATVTQVIQVRRRTP